MSAHTGSRRVASGDRRRARRLHAGAAAHLLALQARDGHWCAELTADTTLESDFILFQLWLHPPQDGVLESADRGR